jgi:DNA-binding transcriptional LysR family regulator
MRQRPRSAIPCARGSGCRAIDRSDAASAVPSQLGFLTRLRDAGLEPSLSNAVEDQACGGADLAIRVGRWQDSSLAQRWLDASGLVLVATPACLARAGIPAEITAMDGHELIVDEPLGCWRPVDLQSETERSRSRLHACAWTICGWLSAAVEGSGILLCPALGTVSHWRHAGWWSCYPALEGRLIPCW